ncbi:MAG TPA: divergent polysaccharide deacetylase family protein [Rhizomicrobium sp.]|nr:divergent polysaccharide deacetylase family protein [Rhizomicrobium sp.]
MIRKANRRHSADKALVGAEAIFWLVLALAIGLGGMRAVSGLPGLMSVLLPPGLMAAEAGSPDDARVSFPVTVRADNGLYAPHVLAAGPGFPQWLQARIAFAQTGGVPAAGSAPRQVPAIAIVIDDLGADGIDTRRAIALPKEVSLSFLPYPADAPEFAREGFRAGHQILVHVPMEPDGRTDPGPNALLTSLDSATNLSRLDWALSRIPGFSGINNHEGSRFTADRNALLPVIEHLAERHVFFLDSRTAPVTEVVSLARAFGVRSAGRDVFLDDSVSPQEIAAQLARAETIAREQGVVIAIGHPHPETMEVLARWTAGAASRGYELVTASDAIRRKTERDVRLLSAAR